MISSKKGLAGGGGLVAAAIIAAVFQMEGGYSDDPGDPGGATNHGITEEVARANGYKGSMRDLPASFAEQVYYDQYIVQPGYLPLVTIQPAVAHKLIDAGVNAGTGRSSRWFQLSLNALSRGGQDYKLVEVSGKVGAGTVQAYQALEKVRGRVKACELVLKLVDAQQATHYMGLTNLRQFTVGWVDHRIGNVPLTSCRNYPLPPDGEAG